MNFIFVLIIFLFIVGNFYVFQRIWLIMPPHNIGRIILVSTGVFLVASLFISFLFKDKLPAPLSSFFYITGTSWAIIFLYIFMLTLLKDLIRLIRLVPADSFSHYTKDNWAGLALAFGFITMLMICGYLKYRWKVRVEVPVATEKKFENRESLRIVAISDLHLGYGIGKPELKEWIDLINAEEPEIVLLAGDIIDTSPVPVRKDSLHLHLKEINAPLGVYACMGNHEYISGANESIKFLEDAGIQLLRDSHALVDSSFYIVGRDDRVNRNRKTLAELVKPLDKSKPIILLDHQPFNLEEAEQNGIDLQFSGHTHRGQVWPISLITDRIYENSHGLLKKGKTHIYVSSGIAVWGGKFRIGTQSEYVVIDIKQQ